MRLAVGSWAPLGSLVTNLSIMQSAMDPANAVSTANEQARAATNHLWASAWISVGQRGQFRTIWSNQAQRHSFAAHPTTTE